MNIQYIKDNVVNEPYFFSEDTMNFFNQKLKDFKVKHIEEDIYKVSAPMRNHNGEVMGKTVRYFNRTNNKFYFKLKEVEDE